MIFRFPLIAACVLAWMIDCSSAVADVKLQLTTDKVTKSTVVQACGLSDGELLEVSGLSPDKLAPILRLFVKNSREAGQPVLGSCTLDDRCLIFAPRFPLEPGVIYVAEFQRDTAPAVRQELSITKPTLAPSTRIATVYPTAEILPQNLLKFYLHFTAPMSQGEAYRFIELSTVDGKVLEHPFLEIAEELWDRSGQRLTLLLDPGRVKRGLVPREEDGPILLAGQRYRLTIKADWPDARGVPLASGFVKSFHVAGEDFKQPDPANWSINPARARTIAPITFTFPEPLDHATLARGITLANSRGEIIRGDFTFSAHETRAHFTPLKPWKAGLVDVHISPVIEDLVGNSIERAFEVDRFDEVETAPPRSRSITIEIRP